MAPLKLNGSVYVQANFHSATVPPSEEAAFVDGMSKAAPFPVVFTTYAPLDQDPTDVLTKSKRYEGFRGIRFMLDYHPSRPELSQTDRGDYMTDATFLKGVKLMEDHDLLFELQLCQVQLLEASQFVAKFPKLTFVLNHAGFPLRGFFDEWAKGIDALAAQPNVVVKIGGLGCYDKPAWSQREVNTYVEHAITSFGVNRSMFASNLPVDLIDIPDPRNRYLSLLRAAKAAGYSDDVKALFHDNAARIYRIF